MTTRKFIVICIGQFLLIEGTAIASTQQEVIDFLKSDVILIPNPSVVNLWMTANPLDSTHVARDRDLAIMDTPFPFSSSWLVMIDDNPLANFGHSVRYLFVEDNPVGPPTTRTPPIFSEYPPTVWANGGAGPQLSFGCVGDLSFATCPPTTPSPSTSAPGGIDKDCLYAVLISGGINDLNNAPRYAQNLRSMYKKLRACGYPKANIFVYYTDNTDSLDLDNADGDNNDATGSDVNGAASESNIRTSNDPNGTPPMMGIKTLCQTLDPDRDVLFIYTSNHGKDNAGLHLWDFDNDGKDDPIEIYTPSEFAADTMNCKVCRLFVIMDQCFSGEFTALAGDGNHANMAIYTAANAAEPSWGRQYMAQWEMNNPGTTTINDMHNDVVTNGGLNSTPQTAEGTAGNGDVSLCFCWQQVWDYVLSFSSVIWSPGIWTKDGTVIGETFSGGVQTGGTEPTLKWDHKGLPASPNDWHWHADFPWLGNPVSVWVWFRNFGISDQLGVDIYCSDLHPQYSLDVDVTGDTYSLLEGSNGPIFFTGIWTQYPGDLPLDFTDTGHRRSNFLSSIEMVPAVSNLGLVLLVLMTAVAGVIVIRRARRGHAAA